MKRIKLTDGILMIAVYFSLTIFVGAQTKRVANDVLTYDGFGSVKVGMRFASASRSFTTGLVRDANAENACYYANAKRGFRDVNFMFTNGKLARIDVRSKNYSTAEGARIGDTEVRVKRLYKDRVIVTPHKYTDGHYLTIKRGKFAYVFETDGKRVTGFRAGKFPEVEYVEGCS